MLKFLWYSDKLAVGSITNMYDIVEMMEKAGKVIKPWGIFMKDLIIVRGGGDIATGTFINW